MDEFEFFFQKPWSDGLPVIPPTEERITAMLSGTRLGASEVIGLVPPLMGEASVEAVAAHAVMAGCEPSYLPVVLAGLRALLAPKLNLNGVQGTMHSAAPLIIVNGPYSKKIGLHGGTGCIGPGFRANATIGRTIRLILMNLGGGVPVSASMSTFGSPARYTFCFAENEAESPWEPLSVARGFQQNDDVVTAVMTEAPQGYIDDYSKEPESFFVGLADKISTLGSLNIWLRTQVVVALGPDHARMCADAGLEKKDVHRRIMELARRPLGELRKSGYWREEMAAKWPFDVDLQDDSFLVPAIKNEDDLILIVAGGTPGPVTAVMPGWVDGSEAVSTGYQP
ncbi:MAG: hypothetical protein OXG62_02830 [Nitrospinae bacterium]|nr:hypothetical protein [Nitrospinota bacterium]